VAKSTLKTIVEKTTFKKPSGAYHSKIKRACGECSHFKNEQVPVAGGGPTPVPVVS